MKKFLICSAATAALAGLAPALAQDAAEAPRAEKLHSRAEVQAKVAEHFARLDADRDGFVTKAEAESGRKALRERFAERKDERLDRRFDRIDSNNDGSINPVEFEAAHAKRAEHRGRRMGLRAMKGHFGGRLFAMADADNDQRVSLQEAQAAALKHFDMADANRDGQVTRDERRQMRRNMITERRPG